MLFPEGNKIWLITGIRQDRKGATVTWTLDAEGGTELRVEGGKCLTDCPSIPVARL